MTYLIVQNSIILFLLCILGGALLSSFINSELIKSDFDQEGSLKRTYRQPLLFVRGRLIRLLLLQRFLNMRMMMTTTTPFIIIIMIRHRRRSVDVRHPATTSTRAYWHRSRRRNDSHQARIHDIRLSSLGHCTVVG